MPCRSERRGSDRAWQLFRVSLLYCSADCAYAAEDVLPQSTADPYVRGRPDWQANRSRNERQPVECNETCLYACLACRATIKELPPFSASRETVN